MTSADSSAGPAGAQVPGQRPDGSAPRAAELAWPPEFAIDKPRVLDLLTGDRFYSSPGAALREAVLNGIDAIQRRCLDEPKLAPRLRVTFDQRNSTLTVEDNGVGMGRDDLSQLFATIGASASTRESSPGSVGEFGIGVISYFMAAKSFEVHTYDGLTEPIGLSFDESMRSGGRAQELSPNRTEQGTTVRLQVSGTETFQQLVDEFPHWCRDVEGLQGLLLPSEHTLSQGGAQGASTSVEVTHPPWVERSNLGPVVDPTAWDALDGSSSVVVLYRGVYVQEFQVKGPWGIEGSIDVDPKHFKPKLNREGFVGKFRSDVEAFLRDVHPYVLQAMAQRVADAFDTGKLSAWTERRWASLWLAVPRDSRYKLAAESWDAVFRTLPAFELSDGKNWRTVSADEIATVPGDVYVAPLENERSDDVVKAAVHLLRAKGRPVIRGVRREDSFLRFARTQYSTTADLISEVFSAELPRVVRVSEKAEAILSAIDPVSQLFSTPTVELVRLGKEAPPALRLKDRNRLLINIDHRAGKAIAEGALHQNTGPSSLILLAATHAYEQLAEVAAVVRPISEEPEILSPVRRRYIEGHLK
jgi:hypothetical protein